MSTITELRTCLFETLRGLQDTASPMDIDRARAINETAQTIINSAKVEVEHIKITGKNGTGFISETELKPGKTAQAKNISQTETGTKTVEGGVTRHHIK